MSAMPTIFEDCSVMRMTSIIYFGKHIWYYLDMDEIILNNIILFYCGELSGVHSVDNMYDVSNIWLIYLNVFSMIDMLVHG